MNSYSEIKCERDLLALGVSHIDYCGPILEILKNSQNKQMNVFVCFVNVFVLRIKYFSQSDTVRDLFLLRLHPGKQFVGVNMS